MLSIVANSELNKVDTVMTVMMVLVIEYNGKAYHGSQWQSELPTIQGEIEKALEKLTSESVRVAMASRTDAGVHAIGQVVSFQTASTLSTDNFISGLNYYLPQDIAIKSVSVVGDSFDVRRSAVKRHYRYSILNTQIRSPLRETFACRIAGTLDIVAMNRACQIIIGEHDFASFASDIGGEDKSTVRKLYRAEVTRDGDLVTIDIVANAFVRHQVRSTAGCLVQIGLGRMSQEEFRDIIKAKCSGLAGPTLPACGLCLVGVEYPSFN